MFRIEGLDVESMMKVANRHMAAGVEDLTELARLCEQETGKTPSMRSLMSYRSKFRRYGVDWLDKRDPESLRTANSLYYEANRDKLREKSREWGRNNAETKRETNRAWLEANRDHAKTRCRQWRRENAAKALLGQARGNSRRRGREVSITEQEVEALLAPGVCSLTGLPFYGDVRDESSSSRDPWAPSLDRIDTTRGYVLGNVRVVCWIVNYMRGDYPDEVVAKAARAIADALGA